MAWESDVSKQADIKIEHLYETILMTLIKDMKQSLADQRVRQCFTMLLKAGYSKQELIKYVHTFIKDE